MGCVEKRTRAFVYLVFLLGVCCLNLNATGSCGTVYKGWFRNLILAGLAVGIVGDVSPEPIISSAYPENKLKDGLTLSEASSWMQYLEEKLPYQCTYKGCIERTHLAARWLELNQIKTTKAFLIINYPDEVHPHQGVSRDGTVREIRWFRHAAVVVNVKEKNGELREYVLDPSVNFKPTPLDNWVEDTIGPNSKHYKVHRMAKLTKGFDPGAAVEEIPQDTDALLVVTPRFRKEALGKPGLVYTNWDRKELENSQRVISKISEFVERYPFTRAYWEQSRK